MKHFLLENIKSKKQTKKNTMYNKQYAHIPIKCCRKYFWNIIKYFPLALVSVCIAIYSIFA